MLLEIKERSYNDKMIFQKDVLSFLREFADLGPGGKQQSFRQLHSTGTMNWKLKELLTCSRFPSIWCFRVLRRKMGDWEPGWKGTVISLWFCASSSGRRKLALNKTGLPHKTFARFGSLRDKRLKSYSNLSRTDWIFLGVLGLKVTGKGQLLNQKAEKVVPKEQR